MKRILVLVAAVMALVGSACGSDATTVVTEQPEPGGDDIVFVWSENGGCAMAGPNCARYEIAADGSVTTYRQNFESWTEAATGEVAAAPLEQWIDMAQQTDVDALTARLGPGEVTAAFDGVDFVLGAPHVGLEISSTEFAFDRDEPFFATARELAVAAAQGAPLELETR